MIGIGRFAAMVLLFGAGAACARSSDASRLAADGARRALQPGMAMGAVVSAADAQQRPWRLLGFCGPRGALNVHGGEGGPIVAWRGSPSGETGSGTESEISFESVGALQKGLVGSLLADGPCSQVSVAFEGWQFWVHLDAAGLVGSVGSLEQR